MIRIGLYPFEKNLLLTARNKKVSRIHRSYLKKVFSPDIGVEPSSQVLDILEYACGLILGLVLISNENPNFEIASNENP
jgi:hypothetical protein